MKIMKALAKRMKISNELREYLMKMIKLHLRPIALAKEGVTDKAIRRLIVEAGDDIDDLMILCRADITTKNEMKIQQRRNITLGNKTDEVRKYHPNAHAVFWTVHSHPIVLRIRVG